MTARDDYFQECVPLGNMGLPQEIHLLLHSAAESYSSNYQELFGRLPQGGQRNYYHAKPYLSRWTGSPMGNLLAWYYPTIQAALFELYRNDNPLEDPLLSGLWAAFEGLVLDRNPGAHLIYMPNWEPVYEVEHHYHFRDFLQRLGYRPSQDHRRLMLKKL